MSEKAVRAMIEALMRECAPGRQLIETPQEFALRSPCPTCATEIMPSHLCFSTEHKPVRRADRDVITAVMVCSGCLTNLIADQPGKYRAMSKRDFARLPEETREFLRRNREMIECCKRRLN